MSAAARRAYRARIVSDWGRDVLAMVLTLFFIWLCVGPVLDGVCELFGMPLR